MTVIEAYSATSTDPGLDRMPPITTTSYRDRRKCLRRTALTSSSVLHPDQFTTPILGSTPDADFLRGCDRVPGLRGQDEDHRRTHLALARC